MRSGDSRKALIRRVLKGGSAGFAAVDALVALTVLTSTLILALGAAGSAQRAAAAALEARHAQQLLSFIMNRPTVSPGIWTGADRGLKWRLQIVPLGGAAGQSAWPLCRRTASARSQRTGRQYEFSTLEVCSPAKDA